MNYRTNLTAEELAQTIAEALRQYRTFTLSVILRVLREQEGEE